MTEKEISLNTGADAAQSQTPSQAPVQRKHTEVAVGVLLRETDGALLITSRPPGKPYAGYWEFPGGKIESGETVEQALRRELQEELGVEIAAAPVWKVTEHDYPHALVRLHWCKITRWSGEFEMREGQQMAWQQLPLQVQPVLPGAYPVLQWLSEERGLPFDAGFYEAGQPKV
ncbi:(deoxy)nucleoside triphosphate pyrophosphohydrolase [Delftia acidovorans]|uniref:8-oxo-dGTP diphosphatase n=1 Tax=Delftia acidovorans TaxID=80866 RepID=A0AAJ2QWV2_DELAC|nr:NUDIX domain-containing protein [Delftia acidovorans]MDX4953391.1 NUDIX domain-containing protein [Delftia acidovorans]